MAEESHILTGAYALDALTDDAERAAVEAHLAVCAACREEVRTLRATAARLAAPPVAPPARLRDAVLAEIARTPQTPAAPPVQPPQPVRPAPPAGTGRGRPAAGGGDAAAPTPGEGPDGRAPARVPPSAPRGMSRRAFALAAATLVVAGAGAGAAGWWQARDAERDADRARLEAQRLVEVVSEPSARRLAARASGGGDLTVVVAGARAAVLADGVPALAGDRTYQLWIIAGKRITSAGLGPSGTAAAGSWGRLVDGVRPGESVAVSVEPRGGSAQPTTTPIAVVAV